MRSPARGSSTGTHYLERPPLLRRPGTAHERPARLNVLHIGVEGGIGNLIGCFVSRAALVGNGPSLLRSGQPPPTGCTQRQLVRVDVEDSDIAPLDDTTRPVTTDDIPSDANSAMLDQHDAGRLWELSEQLLA